MGCSALTSRQRGLKRKEKRMKRRRLSLRIEEQPQAGKPASPSYYVLLYDFLASSCLTSVFLTSVFCSPCQSSLSSQHRLCTTNPAIVFSSNHGQQHQNGKITFMISVLVHPVYSPQSHQEMGFHVFMQKGPAKQKASSQSAGRKNKNLRWISKNAQFH